MQRGNREVIENKLTEHFSKVKKIVEAFEDKMKGKLEELMDEQTTKLNDV